MSEKKGIEPNPPTRPPQGPAPEQPPPSANDRSIVARPANIELTQVGDKGIILKTFEELRRFAELAVNSGAAPKGMRPGGAALAIQAGLERGLGPLGGLQYCTIINGTLSWNAQGATALIRTSPVCKRGSFRAWVEGEGDEMKGVAVAWRVGDPAPERAEFSVADARAAELLTKDNWKKYRKRQLKARAIGFLARDLFSDVLGGFPLAEEVEDFEPINVTPTAVTAHAPPPAATPDPVLEALRPTTVVEVVPAGEVIEGSPIPTVAIDITSVGPAHSDADPTQAQVVVPQADTPLEVADSLASEGKQAAEVLEAEVGRVSRTLRATLGVPETAAKGPPGEQNPAGEVPEASVVTQTSQADPKTPETVSEGVSPDRHPVTSACAGCGDEFETALGEGRLLCGDCERQRHLEADAALAEQSETPAGELAEQNKGRARASAGLFDEQEKAKS